MQIPLTNRGSGAGGFGWAFFPSHVMERCRLQSGWMLLNVLWSPCFSLLTPVCSSAICFNSPSPLHGQGPPGYPVIHLCGIRECCFSASTQVGKRVIKVSEINQNLLWWTRLLRALDAKRVIVHVYSDTTLQYHTSHFSMRVALNTFSNYDPIRDLWRFGNVREDWLQEEARLDCPISISEALSRKLALSSHPIASDGTESSHSARTQWHLRETWTVLLSHFHSLPGWMHTLEVCGLSQDIRLPPSKTTLLQQATKGWQEREGCSC